MSDDELRNAFRAVRESYDGSHPEPDATLERALFRARRAERKQRLTRWFVLPIAATLLVSTAWAGVSGRLVPAFHAVAEALHIERAPHEAPRLAEAPRIAETAQPTSSAPESAPADLGAANDTKVVLPPKGDDAAKPAAHPSSEASPRAAARTSEASAKPEPTAPELPAPAPTNASSEAARAAAAGDPNASLFVDAYRLHFAERDPARALPAWDSYLAAAPNGRFAPEARYNRALALIRLGRHAEARPALEAFANGAYGTYRRDEAKALLAALTTDAAP